jgi:glucose-1-phosphate adenylyltransferase
MIREVGDALMQDILTLVLGGGRGPGLYPLTRSRSKPAVSIAGKYRLLDIPLSNCINSGCNRIYVLTQFLSVSLHRHIINTYKFDPFGRTSFVAILAAQQTNEATDWYRGSADAVRQHLRQVEEDSAERVFVAAGDQLYRMDFRRLAETHAASEAGVTLAVVPVTRAQAPRLGILRLDAAGRVVAFLEKPQDEAQLDALRLPDGWLAQHGIVARDRQFLANMGNYLFRRDVLLEMVRSEPQAHEFGSIFPSRLERYHVHGHLFNGYWEDLKTIPAYHTANLALASDAPPFDFHSPEGVIFTRMRNLPTAHVSATHMEQCLVSDGCTVKAGTRLDRCVVGLRVTIGRDVALRDTVVCGATRFETPAERAANRTRGIPDLGVGDGSHLEHAILDRDCRIGRDVQIVNRRQVRDEDGANYVIRDGIVIIPTGAVVADGSVI